MLITRITSASCAFFRPMRRRCFRSRAQSHTHFADQIPETIRKREKRVRAKPTRSRAMEEKRRANGTPAANESINWIESRGRRSRRPMPKAAAPSLWVTRELYTECPGTCEFNLTERFCEQFGVNFFPLRKHRGFDSLRDAGNRESGTFRELKFGRPKVGDGIIFFDFKNGL